MNTLQTYVSNNGIEHAAVAAGFTDAYLAASPAGELAILVRPDADLGDKVTAWDMDEQEYVYLAGWLWTFDPL